MKKKTAAQSCLQNSALFSKWGLYRKGMDSEAIQLSFANHLEYSLSKDKYTATVRDLWHSLALAARDRMVERWIRTQQLCYKRDVKRVYYLSAEYLMGRALINNLISLGMYDETKHAMQELNLDLDELAEQELDAGLGNGGLGRLAACFMDSLAALQIPAYGYGIRYEFGIFDQVIRNLQQVELPDEWLKFGNPWEIERPERACIVRFYGRIEEHKMPDGRLVTKWLDTRDVVGVPHDTPIDGYGNETVNSLRLWAARASNEFDLGYFQEGDYLKAVEEKNISENISKVLYPSDHILEGQELRLQQQYFFVSCSIQDIVRRYLVKQDNFDAFPDKVAIQMNDTHPALAVPELMRILLDDYELSWEKAWDITSKTCAYTNHTLLSEAMEKWSVSLLGNLLPRHLMIIYEINRRFLRDVSVHYLGDTEKLARMSIIEETDEQKVRMANLAIVGSHSVNGVAALHTKLLREREFRDFDEMFPGKFNNKTNGITPRRWLLAANPDLARLISSKIGKDWAKDLNQIRKIEDFACDAAFQNKWMAIKRQNKERLANVTKELTGIIVDPDSIYDVHVKRIHEYKRQLLNILHIIVLWLEHKHNLNCEAPARTFFFGGKAAPGYYAAKKVIQLVCHVGELLNQDPDTSDKLKVVFLPNYRVTLAEQIIPATDVSEQISTAGFEASGTSNMKFALNGAITVGTLDGANVEMKEEIGEENIFIFGLTTEQVNERRANYNPYNYYARNPELKEAIDMIRGGFFSPEQPDLFASLIAPLLSHDPYFVLADFEGYRRCQADVGHLYSDQAAWTEKAIYNVARVGMFSSDRTIFEYNRDIWRATPQMVRRERRS